MNSKLLGLGDKLIVFLHGFGGGFESFQGVASRLQMRYKCLLISFFDAEPIKPLTLDDYCDYVASQIAEVDGVSEVILVGHSFGGRVAIRLAAHGIGDKLVLVDSAGMKPRRKLSYYYRIYKYKLKRLLGLPVDGDGSEDYRTLSPIMKATFVNIVNTYQEGELYHIHIPTLIVWGDEDYDTPLYMARRLNEGIADSRLYIYTGAGHYSYLDRSEQFVSNLRSFCG